MEHVHEHVATPKLLRRLQQQLQPQLHFLGTMLYFKQELLHGCMRSRRLRSGGSCCGVPALLAVTAGVQWLAVAASTISVSAWDQRAVCRNLLIDHVIVLF